MYRVLRGFDYTIFFIHIYFVWETGKALTFSQMNGPLELTHFAVFEPLVHDLVPSRSNADANDTYLSISVGNGGPVGDDRALHH